MAVHIPRLRAKVDLIKAELEVTEDRALAPLVGISPQTLSGYLGDNATAPDRVSERAFENMANLLANRLAGRLTLHHARLALRADFPSFQLAIGPFPKGAFGRLLAETAPSLGVTLETFAPMLEMTDADPPDPAIETVPADHSFQLTVTGPERDHLVILGANATGWHLAAPRDGLPITFPAGGKIRAPRRRLNFDKNGGLHTFYAFAIRGGAPPRIITRDPIATPVTPDELMVFATDLADGLRTFSFAVGRLLVFAQRPGLIEAKGAA